MEPVLFMGQDLERIAGKLRALGWVQDREGCWIDPIFTGDDMKGKKIYSENIGSAIACELGVAARNRCERQK